MAEEKKQKFAAAEAKGGPGGGGPHARGGFQKPKDTKKTIKRLLTYITTRKSLLVLIGVTVVHRLGLIDHLWDSVVNSGVIANTNSLFNLLAAVALFPLLTVFEKIGIRIVKDDAEPEE